MKGNDENVSIDQIRKSKLAVNRPIERPVARFPLHEIIEINLQFGIIKSSVMKC